MKAAGARVLIVEDNAMNRELLDYLLRAYGFQTLQAVDGRIGLEVARRERPDLILCDIQMPELDGLGFARAAKADATLRDTPLIAVTAFAMVGDRERVLAEGFDDYIAKPIEPLSLLDAIGRVLPGAQEGAGPPNVAAGDRRAGPAPGAATAAPAMPPQRSTILALDDSPFNLELKRDLLEPHGYTVLTADTPEQALGLARAHRPALIISDVGMARGSGFDFIRTVKADPDLADIPFVFLSATHWNEDSRREGLALGAVRYLLRPLDPALLLAEIQACLG